jgi:hypothetical protein
MIGREKSNVAVDLHLWPICAYDPKKAYSSYPDLRLVLINPSRKPPDGKNLIANI